MSDLKKPICPECDTDKYVSLIKTASQVGTVTGAVAGGAAGYAGAAGGAAAGAAIGSIIPYCWNGSWCCGRWRIGCFRRCCYGWLGRPKAGEAIDESRALYKCNKCGKEFNG